ncbi:hypothetical protein CW751_03720 [Brumimicrobium salinarum]|uniref:Orotate phosphoribosyltransferase n=1 Tax=Brumimicrobium salinarum TaxID=2058658 RepID=A0A2I0R4X9_9FLAO|nr:hypothetical protein [Brumimicrobium salinarum]PKR81644.1 hypothetical protein CW751_03720 [Brumimicrobium salinarum]
MKIKSEKTVVNADVKSVFNFISDTRNLEQLLPENEVKDFQGSEKDCSFKVQGGIVISLEQKELIPTQEIKMTSGSKSPFPFKLSVHLEDKDGKTEGYIAFDGEVNAFLKMMVKKPLTNLFNHMTERMTTVFADQK